MYIPKLFSETRPEVMHQFIKDHPFATLVTAGSEGIVANLVPMNFHPVGQQLYLRFHLARHNSQLQSLSRGDQLLVIFQGPQAYVTPNFYPTKKTHGKAVPTWNYSTVQVRGRAQVMDDVDWILQHVSELTEVHEKNQPTPWKVSDAPKEYIDNLLRAIVGVEIEIETIEAKFKVSQNQPAENNLAVEKEFQNIGENEMAKLVAKHRPS